ncbi:hypothetical protein DVH05_018813 [Phytophthora capsici]|nr:hypothetical protein DVH05_018813 [Phytophthora capsici]
MGGPGADGELVLQVATVASATEDVTKELEAASKTVSALLRYEWEVLVLMVSSCCRWRPWRRRQRT